MPRNQAVVATKEIAEIAVGDKLLTDIVGYKGRTLLHRGMTISVREKNWLAKKCAESKPRLASEKYRTQTKAMGTIRAKDGSVLVKPGELITAEKLAPLLKEGFKVQETFEAEQTMFYRPTIWPENADWHISDFNPIVQVETMMLVNDDGSPAAAPKAKAKTKEATGAGAQ